MPATVIRPARNIAGSLRLPGDKSISHRYAMLAAIAEGTTRLENFSTGADCASTLGCREGLGRRSGRNENGRSHPGPRPRFASPGSPLDCGNSGSTMRMLSGILAGQEFSCELIGDESLSRRPMARIITPLEMHGRKDRRTERRTPAAAHHRGKTESHRLQPCRWPARR